jgi:hypothetical protein
VTDAIAQRGNRTFPATEQADAPANFVRTRGVHLTLAPMTATVAVGS